MIQNRSFGLDLARTLAIMLVLVAHLSQYLEQLGFWGVELFFALSGYLIGQILWTSYSSTSNWTFAYLKNFWFRRWWRTLPNYYLFIVVSLVYHYAPEFHLPRLDYLAKFLYFCQSFFSNPGEFFGVSWSLCIEEWFYLMFPCLLFLLGKAGLKPKTGFITSICLVSLFCFLTRASILNSSEAHDLRTITIGRIDAISFGVAIAFFELAFNFTKRANIALFVLGCTILSFAVVYINLPGGGYAERTAGHLMLTLVPIGFAAVLPLSKLARFPSNDLMRLAARAVELTSLWSYSIYLCHIPLIVSAYYLMAGFRENWMGNLLSKILGLAITFAVSKFLYNFFELPLTKRGRLLF